jgi:hypothetical protein
VYPALGIRDEVEQLCASVETLLAGMPPDQALREWMDHVADYVEVKRAMGTHSGH